MNYLKHSKSCGVQCVAKITGKSPTQIRELATENDLDQTEVVSILRKLGFTVKTPFRATLFEGKKYIVTVPSLNNVGEFHYVIAWYDNGVKIWDPVKAGKGKRYVNRNKKKICEAEFKIRSWTSVIEVKI